MIIDKKIKFGAVVTLVLLTMAFCYRYSPYKLEFLGHYNKIWAHRANSIEKLSSATKYYEGVELDLVYIKEENILDVNHPPSKSIGLNFETYINALSENLSPFLWLDIKNLKEENAEHILDRLLQIFDQNKYPISKVLIETQKPEALPIFSEKGFMTSYYLPGSLITKEESDLLAEISEIKKVLIKQPNLGISTNHRDYPITEKYFPERIKYIWALVPTFNETLDCYGLLVVMFGCELHLNRI